VEITLKLTQLDPSVRAGLAVLFRMTKKRARLCLGILALFASAIVAHAAETIPPKPDRYFNDYAGVVSPRAAQRFNEQLAQFERETSNQIVVAVWRTMPSQSSIEDFTQRTFQAWQVGQKGRNNGAVFFVFVDDHRMRTTLKAAFRLESISYLKQFAGSTKGAERRCGKAGALRVTLPGY
jgi:uncharacterized membrane protein YgcG